MSWDILVLGATGQTGYVTTRCLAQHAEFAEGKFSLCISGRSQSRLKNVVEELGLPGHISTLEVDVMNPDAIQDAAKRTKKVVINTVGPYFLYGTPVVAACAQMGVHYVDLTGETQWIRRIIRDYDYLATKTGAIIIPSCGFDSVPSDLTAYLGAKKVKELEGKSFSGIETSKTAFKVDGKMSLGTFSSFVAFFEDADMTEQIISMSDYSTSPVIGPKVPRFPLTQSVAVSSDKTIYGALWAMGPINTHAVQRTWGLLQANKNVSKELVRYGKDFKYNEFIATSGHALSLFVSSIILVAFTWIFLAPTRSILKYLAAKLIKLPKDEKELSKGGCKVTNITTSAAGTKVQTVYSARGDPGYFITCFMLAEAALTLALSHESLSDLAKTGGILTPMTGLGDVFVERLRGNERMSIECGPVDEQRNSKKRV